MLGPERVKGNLEAGSLDGLPGTRSADVHKSNPEKVIDGGLSDRAKSV